MNSEPALAKWLRWLIYSSSLVPLIIFGQYVSPFHFGKVIVLRTVVQVMAGLYLMLIWRDRSYRPKGHPITWAFFAFTLAFTLTTFTGVAFLQSFWGTLERMGGLFTFWHYFIFYIILVSVLRTKEDWRTLIDLMVAVGFVSAIYGFLQKTNWSLILGSGERQRIFGTIGNPALFAGYQILIGYLAVTMLLMRQYGPAVRMRPDATSRGIVWIGIGIVSAIFLGAAFNGHSLWVIPMGLVSYGVYLIVSTLFPNGGRWFYGISAGLIFLAAASTAVRGSLLAMAVATVVGLILWSSFNRSRRARNALLGSIAACVLFFFFAALLRSTPLVQHSPYLKRITDFSSQTQTVQTRFWAWSAGFKGWSESPQRMLLGWGPENFNVPFSKYFNPKFFMGPGSETFFDRAHNMFIEILVTMGLAGELTYLALFGVLFWTLVRFMRSPDNKDLRALGIGGTAFTIAYIIHNCFIFDTSANFLTFFMVLGFVAHVSQYGLDSAPDKPDQKRRPMPWTGLQYAGAGIISLVVLITVYITSIQQAKANFASTRAIIAGWNGDFVTAVTKYREAIAYDVPGRYEYRNRFAQYLLETSAGADTSKVPGFNEAILEVIGDLQQNIQENPQDYLPLLYTARMYITLGKDNPQSPYNDMALQYANKALVISPTFVRTYYEVAQAYLNKQESQKAYDAFEAAYKLNPDVQLTQWYMAIVDFQLGRVDEGLAIVESLISNGYTLSESDALKVINAYIKKGDLKNVAILYGQLVKTSPTNATYWTQLAVVYARLGRIPEAIAATREALKLDKSPEFQQQGQAFLRQLGATP